MKPFIIAYTVFVLVLTSLLLVYTKEELFLQLNGFYSDFGDAIFPYITHLGTGLLTTLVVIVFLFIKYRWAIIAAASFIVAGVVTMFLKLVVFETWLRPTKYFEGGEAFHTVIGVDMHSYNSFPSGHSSTVFSVCFFLALILKGKHQAWGILFMALAVLVGYSRIYLGQHFPEDVLAGSAIGVGLTFICYKVMDRQLSKKSWSDKALFKKA